MYFSLLELEVNVQDAFDKLFEDEKIEFLVENMKCLPDYRIEDEYEKRFGNQVIEEEN